MEYQGLHRYVEGNEDFVRFILSGISAMCAGTGLCFKKFWYTAVMYGSDQIKGFKRKLSTVEFGVKDYCDVLWQWSFSRSMELMAMNSTKDEY